MSLKIRLPAARARRALLVVLIALGSTATLLVAAETAYRIRGSRGRAEIRYYRHGKIEHALVPDADYDGAIHINHFGFRGREITVAKAPGTTRIIALGASTTFDPCARADSETWTARLEYYLGQLAPGAKFEVINGGVPTFPMVDHIIRLQTELYAFEPDVFVVYAGHGIVTARDALPAHNTSPRRKSRAVRAVWTSWLQQHSQLYQRIRARSKTDVNSAVPTDAQWTSAIDHMALDFSRDLTSLTAIARSMGAQVVFAEINRVTGAKQPDDYSEAERAAWQGYIATPPQIVHAGYERFADVWASVAENAGATFIPADSFGISGAQNFCERDPIHFSRAGSDAMGRRLAQQLIARGVVSGS